MKITGFLPESYQDWDAGLSSVIFTGRCSWNCGICHAGKLLDGENSYSDEEIISRLIRKRNYISKVVISGGEPTLETDLENFIDKIKKHGLDVKLDTNGSNPETLARLIGKVDYISLDIKSDRENYPKVVRVDVDLNAIEESVGLLAGLEPGTYEFRTTYPLIRENGRYRWMRLRGINSMAAWISRLVRSESRKASWYVQPFVSREDDMLHPEFSQRNLLARFHRTPDKLLEKTREVISGYFPNCKIR